MRFARRISHNYTTVPIYVTALFNIFLILLIFIIFYPNIVGPCGFQVMLPKTIASDPIPRTGFIVSILKNNAVYLEDKKMSFDEIKHFLSFINKSRDCEVLIKADRGANIGTLVEVWDIFKNSGASKVSIATNE